MKSDQYILLTIDVEDWFQVENFKPWIPFSTWDQRELRVEKNTHRLLDLFDSKKLETNQFVKPIKAINYKTQKVKATFFVLAWIAEKLPHLVREIHARGHEVASHGCNHQLPYRLSVDELKRDLSGSKNQLEDIIGAAVYGFRAPNFATNDNVLKTVEDAGYLYDSSYNSFSLHGRYGKISLNGYGQKGTADRLAEKFFELPISNLQIGGMTFPLGGGGYFRLFPISIFILGIKVALKRQDAFVFYTHPWEFDPNQPRVEKASTSLKFRHYINLSKTWGNLVKLLDSFSQCRFITCSQYLSEAF